MIKDIIVANSFIHANEEEIEEISFASDMSKEKLIVNHSYNIPSIMQKSTIKVCSKKYARCILVALLFF